MQQSDARDFVGGSLHDIPALEQDASARRHQGTANRVEQGRLARAIGTNQRDDGSFGDVDADINERANTAIVNADCFDFKH